MKTNNKYSLTFILEKFNDEQSKEQIKNLKEQLILFESHNKNKNNETNLNPELIIKREKVILSIIQNTLSEKIKCLITNQNTFNYGLFIYIFFDKIKPILSKIIKHTKSIENSLFQKINKNTIKKIQSIIINFLLSFNDFNENEPSYSDIDQIIDDINNKNVLEESYLISYIRIVLIFTNYIEQSKIKNIFYDIKTTKKDFYSYVSDITKMLIVIIHILIIIKKNKSMFNIEDNSTNLNNIIKNSKGYYNYERFESFINLVYKNIEPYLMKLLCDVIFNNNLKYFFGILSKNDHRAKIILIDLPYDFKIRKKLLKMLNESQNHCDKQKELLKALKSNDSIENIFKYIIEDSKNKKYHEISDLLDELKVLYRYSLLIHSNGINSEKLIIQLLKNNLFLLKKDDDDVLKSFINDIYKLIENMPQNKYVINEFLFLIFDSIKIFRKAICEIIFSNINNYEEFLVISNNVPNFYLFINNLSSSEVEVLSCYFNFLYSIVEKTGYLPSKEIIQIIDQLKYFLDENTAKILTDNLQIFTDINYLFNNKDNNEMPFNDGDNDELLISDEDKTLKNKDNNSNKYSESIRQIYERYMNNLYNIFSDIKENINSIKYKSPFDIDVSVSSIINTDFSSPEQDKKKLIPFEIVNIFLDFLSVIINDEKMFSYFISKKFLELFSFLANDDIYKQIAYKIIQIFLNSPNNGLENKEKNKNQLLIILNRYYLLFPKVKSQDFDNNENNYNEIYKLKELLLMQETIIIYFNKQLIEIKDAENKSDNLNEKIIKFYCFYPEYINDNSKDCYQLFNDEYHSLIKKYLNIIIKIIAISNQNVINKNNNYCPTNLKQNIKDTFENIFKFYFNFPDNNQSKKKYCLDLIKFFIDKSFNFTFSKEKINNKNSDNDDVDGNENEDEELISEEDFTLY